MDMHSMTFSFSGHAHPNGAKIFTTSKVTEVAFGQKIALSPEEKYWIIAPAVVNDGKDKSGIITFDTETHELEVIKL